MLPYMKPSNTLWGRVLACCLAVGTPLGFWAGGAAAQTEDQAGWFDDSAQSTPAPAADDDRVTPPSAPDYSAPPPDFQPAPAAPPPAADSDNNENDGVAQQRATQEFSPRLEPYGRWVDDPWYGRVWVPARSVVGSEFVPYSTGGHWELTQDDAWLWASDYPFGAITFHYGRWVWASGGVWGWVPGYVYAPAWVDFHVGAVGYIGWAPLGPSHVWRHGAFLSVGLWQPAPVVYCPTQYVFVRSMPRYLIRDRVQVRSISAQTHVYRPTRYAGGGRVTYLARGPSPAEAHIPRDALPARRVLAQPRLAPLSGVSRTRIESSRLPESQGSGFRSRAYESRSYDAYRGPPPPQRSSPEVRRSTAPRTAWPTPAPRAFDRSERRMSPGAVPPPAYRGTPSRGVPNRGAAYGSAPNRSAPAATPRDRAASRPMPYAAARAPVAPQATRPEADPRGSRRAQRRGDNSNAADSRSRGRDR